MKMPGKTQTFAHIAIVSVLAWSAAACGSDDAAVEGPQASASDAPPDAGGSVGDTSSSSGASSSGASSSGASSSGASSSGASSSGASSSGASSSGASSSGASSSGASSSGASSSGASSSGASSSSSGGSSLPGKLVALTLEPAVATIPIGASLSLDLTGKFADGTSKKINDLAKWTSSSPDVISVSQAGLALGVGAGSATVTATVEGTQATAQVAVSTKKLQALTITPDSGSVQVGGSLAFAAIATMSDGTKESVTDSVTWTSSEPKIATIDAKGLAIGVGAGDATISANIGLVSGQAKLQVKAAQVTAINVEPVDPTLTIGESVSFTATATYADGKVADITKTAKWTSSQDDIVAVSNAGLATAKKPGSATITAEFGGQNGSRVVTVKPATLTKLVIAPLQATVPAGGKQVFTVIGTFSDGASKDFTESATWSVQPKTVAAISNAPGTQGHATGLGAGEATVTATFGKVVATAKLSVTAATLKSIAINGAVGMAKGVQKQLKAIGTYSDSKALDITDKVTWQSSNEKVVTVSNTAPKGWIAAVAEGKATLTASLDGVSGKVEVPVSAAALIKVLVDPSTKVMEAGLKESFGAKAQYSDGSVIDVTSQVVWSSSDPTVAAVSNAKANAGTVSALKAGSVTIKAALGSTIGTSKVTVKQPTLTDLTIGPHNVSRKAGQYVQYWAIAVYSNGATQNVTKQASWETSDASIATIQKGGNWKGVAQGKKKGVATITAKYAGKSVSTKLTVTNPTLVQVQVSPAAWESPVGIPMQFQAVALFSDDSSQNVTWQATWNSTNKTVAQVGNKGGGGGFGGGGANKGRTQSLSPGKTEITATWQGKTGKASLTVTQAKQTGIQIFPGTQTMPAGDWRKFEASLLWSDGKSNPVTQWVSWSSSDSSIAAALNGNGQKGLIQGLKPGKATITAAGLGFKATATIVVTDAKVKSLQLTPASSTVAKGVPVLFKTSAVFTDGTSQDVSWQTTYTSSDPSIVSVNNGNGPMKGMAQTLKAGTVTIKATAKGQTATATVTVKPAELKELQVTPIQPKIAVGAFGKLECVAVFTDGTTQQITWLATWTSSKPDVAAVSNINQPGKGFVQGLKAGETVISAQWGGKTGTTKLTVQQAALLEIQVTPFSPVLPIGYTTQFQATGVFADNTTQNLTGQASWTSSNAKIASVVSAWQGKGRVTPLAAGTVEIIATFGGKQGKTKLKVTAAALTKIEVTPPTATLKQSQQAQLLATGHYADGTKIPLNAYVLWKSDKVSVAPVSNAGGSKGRVTAIAKGTATISAIKGKVTGTAKVTVQ